MKIISFFSRFAVICNIAFVFFIFFGNTNSNMLAAQSRDVVESIPYFKDLVIILGVSAIVINLLMCIVYTVIMIVGKQFLLPKWMVVFNFIFLVLEFYYFLF